MQLCKECAASLDAEIARLTADIAVLQKLRTQYEDEKNEKSPLPDQTVQDACSRFE